MDRQRQMRAKAKPLKCPHCSSKKKDPCMSWVRCRVCNTRYDYKGKDLHIIPKKKKTNGSGVEAGMITIGRGSVWWV